MESKVKFMNEVLEMLKNKPLAVSNSKEFCVFHYPFKNFEESLFANIKGEDKKVLLFYPFSQKNEKTNLWHFSGLNDGEKLDNNQLKKVVPPQIVIAKDKMKSKFQSVFSMKKSDVFDFCIKLDGGKGRLSEPFSYENTLWAIARDMWEQYSKRDIHTEVDRQAVNRIPKKFLANVNNIDALEIVRTTLGRPYTASDEGAENVVIQNGYPVIVPNEEGVIVRGFKGEEFYEHYKVFIYTCKDAAIKQAIRDTVAVVKQKEAVKLQLEDSGKKF